MVGRQVTHHNEGRPCLSANGNDTSRMLAILTLAAAIAFAVSPLMTSGFKGFTPEQFPIPQDNPPVQPAGYAFALWGVIYLWLVAGAGFGLFRRAETSGWNRARPPLVISFAIGAAWIPVANTSPLAATILIWAMLITALIALFRAGPEDRWWLLAPIGLFAGWLTAASCVALGLMLAGYGFVSETTSAILMLVLGLAVAVYTIRTRPSLTYGIGVVWALVGVAVSNAAPPLWPVLMLSLAGIALVTFLTLRA